MLTYAISYWYQIKYSYHQHDGSLSNSGKQLNFTMFRMEVKKIFRNAFSFDRKWSQGVVQSHGVRLDAKLTLGSNGSSSDDMALFGSFLSLSLLFGKVTLGWRWSPCVFQSSGWREGKTELSTFAAKWNRTFVLGGSPCAIAWVVGYRTLFVRETCFYFKQWLTGNTTFIVKSWQTH